MPKYKTKNDKIAELNGKIAELEEQVKQFKEQATYWKAYFERIINDPRGQDW
jgi:hypothetical protein